MITEYNQLMSTACFLHGIHTDDMYRPTHKSHPCVKWVMQSRENFAYLLTLNDALCKEYTHRYSKHHAGERLVKLFKHTMRNYPIGAGESTPFPICVNKDNLLDSDVVSEYRNFYIRDKARFCTWKHRDIPPWFNP